MRIGTRVLCVEGSYAGRRGRVVRDEALSAAPGFVAVEFELGSWLAVRLPERYLELDNAIDALAAVVREEECGARADPGSDQA